MTSRRPLAVALLAPGGLMLSHFLAYLVAYPQTSERESALAGTHGHLGPLLALAACGFLAAVLLAARAGMQGRQLNVAVHQIVFAQAGLYAAMEVGEHMLHGAGIGAAATETTLWLGLCLQLLVGCVVARVLRTAERTGVSLRPLSPRPRRDVLRLRLATLVTRLRAWAWRDSVSERGPPRSLLAD